MIMGKKEKQRASSKGSPSSSAKPSAKSSAKSSATTNIKCKLESMPENHLKTFILNSESMGFLVNYSALLEWVRTMCSLDGSSFEDIRNANLNDSYPLIQIDIYHGDDVRKFLISKWNVYLVAHMFEGKWFVFGQNGYDIEGAEVMANFDGGYMSTSWDKVGPRPILGAMKKMALRDMRQRVKASEKFMVFLCEVARFFPVQNFISKVFVGGSSEDFNMPLNMRELTDFEGEKGVVLSEEDDSYNLTKVQNGVDMTIGDTLSQELKDFIHNWRKLSKIWYAYALTDGKYRHVDPDDVDQYGIKNLKTLRSMMALLCNLNVTKFLEEYEMRIGKFGFTRKLYDLMKENAEKLKACRRVDLPRRSVDHDHW